MTNTIRHKLPFLEISQAQKETTHNEALRILDVLANLLVIRRDLSTPPPSPANGSTYIVATAPVGDWAGQEGKIAFYYDGWTFVDPFEGLQARIGVEDSQVVYNGVSWDAFAGGGSSSWEVDIGSSTSSDQVILSTLDVGSIKPVSTGSDGGIVVLPKLSTISAGNMIGIKKTNSDNNLLLIHGYPLNLLTQSTELNTGWSKTFVTVASNTGLDPDGATTLDKIQEDATTNLHEISQTFTKPFGVTQLIASFVVQAVERDVVFFALDRGSSTHRAEMRVTLSTNTVSNTASAGDAVYVSGTCTALANSNKLITIVVNVTAASNDWSVRLRLFNGSSTYAGTVGSGVYAGRAQLGYGNSLPTWSSDQITTTLPAIETIDGVTTKELRTQNGTVVLFKGLTDWSAFYPETNHDSGTWTPTVSGSTTNGSQLYSTRIGYWVRQNQYLSFSCHVVISTFDGATAGNLRITGLPFSAINASGVQQPLTINVRSNLTLSGGNTMFSAYMTNNSAIINIAQMGSNVAQSLIQASAAASGLGIDVQGTIRIN